MWNLTPDYIQQLKEELKGRRAAIEGRHADELKGIAADLDEIEQLEHIAYAFVVKHLPDTPPADPSGAAPMPPVEIAKLQPPATEPISEDIVPKARAESKSGLSRLVRLDT
jgi:hypothetical protein